MIINPDKYHMKNIFRVHQKGNLFPEKGALLYET